MCECLGRKPWLDNQESAWFQVVRHVSDGPFESLFGFDIAYTAEETDDNIEPSVEVEVCHVSLVEYCVRVFRAGYFEHVRVIVYAFDVIVFLEKGYVAARTAGYIKKGFAGRAFVLLHESIWTFSVSFW